MAKEKITHSICVGGPLTIHTVDGVIRRVRPIVLTDDDAPGWVIKAHGKEYTPQRKTTLSLLGFTEKDRTYSYDRIKYPMRRTNEKGVRGEFERITWEEAIDQITDAMAAAIKEEGPHVVGTGWAHASNMCLYPLTMYFNGVFGTDARVIQAGGNRVGRRDLSVGAL